MAMITSTDLWGDVDGVAVEEGDPIPFFAVSDAETGNVTIDGIRASGIDQNRLVYFAGMDDTTEDYTPTVRLCVSAPSDTARAVIGVTAHPAQIDDKVAVYNSGVVKVKIIAWPGMESATVSGGRFLIPSDDGYVKSAPDIKEEGGGLSYTDQIVGKAYQSAAAGDEFLMKLML